MAHACLSVCIDHTFSARLLCYKTPWLSFVPAYRLRLVLHFLFFRCQIAQAKMMAEELRGEREALGAEAAGCEEAVGRMQVRFLL
jgi:hypothetical protein